MLVWLYVEWQVTEFIKNLFAYNIIVRPVKEDWELLITITCRSDPIGTDASGCCRYILFL